MDVLVLIGRILFVMLFLSSGAAHLLKTEAMAGYAASRGVSPSRPATLVGGVLILVGGLMVLLGIWADLGALLLFFFLVPTAVLMHAFWTESNPADRQNEMTQFNKDMALAGASLMLMAFFSYVGHDLGLTMTGPLFNIG